MKRASVREVQHGLARILDQVSEGQEIVVTRRGKVVARIVPSLPSRKPLAWPDSAARLKRLAADGATGGTPPSKIIEEGRQERL